jgi:hypothetical protein
MMASFINTIDLLGDTATSRALVSRTITEFNDDALTSIGERIFEDCESLTSVSMPNATTIFGSHTFFYCKALTSVDLPNVTSISSYAFYECSALSSVNIPNVTSIGDRAFYNCKALASVDLSNVTSIGSTVFYQCSALSSVRLPETPPTLSDTSALIYVNSACIFYIPTGSLTEYQNATNWSSITSKYSFVEENR